MRNFLTILLLLVSIRSGYSQSSTLPKPSGMYETYGLNNIDVNYHLGNSYILFIQSSGTRIMPIYQGILGTFTGTYTASDIENLWDEDIGALPPSLEEKGYTSPPVSLVIWICLALIALILGFF